MKVEQREELIKQAMKAREKSYAPYSHFTVGSAVLTESGKIFDGCNIENVAYSPTICGERVAIFKAVSTGEREIKAIAIAGAPAGKEIEDFCPPCGVCRQVMAEFGCKEHTKILLVKSVDEVKTMSLKELLPEAFSPHNIKND